jgi:hypothetical protein
LERSQLGGRTHRKVMHATRPEPRGRAATVVLHTLLADHERRHQKPKRGSPSQEDPGPCGPVRTVGDLQKPLRRCPAAGRRGVAGWSGLANHRWIACTDADSVMPQSWPADQLRLAPAGADLVLGRCRSGLAPEVERAWFFRSDRPMVTVTSSGPILDSGRSVSAGGWLSDIPFRTRYRARWGWKTVT